MFFNTRSLFAAALLSSCALEVSALDFSPITDPSQIIPPNGAGSILKRTTLEPLTDPTELLPGQAGQAFKRDAGPAPVEMLPIGHPTELTHGRSMKRAVTGKEAFDPKNATTFYWGAYAGDNIYVANFTVHNPFDDEFILPVEQFAKELKSIKCGQPGAPMILEFKDEESYDYAENGWDWVNKEDINKFTLVTEPDQCYKGDNRSPYLVSNIVFDKKTLTANVKAEEKEWSELAHTFDLHLRHQHVPRATVNTTHPHLLRRENSDMDIGHTFNGNLFNFDINSITTAGMALSADAEITTAGHIAADFDIQQKKILGIPTVPDDIKIKIQPQDVTALMKLTLHADGTLGRGIDWSMTPEIDIPIAALNIAKILQIGPFVTIGVHFGSSALSGTGDIVTGAKGSLSNDAEVNVQLRKPEENSFSNWQPTIEKIDPVFSAEFTGDMEAWAELAVVIKAEALGKWGYQAGIEAELPYYRADLLANKDPAGVCGTKKTVGIDIDTSVGIDVSLQAGRINAVADFSKALYTTSWALFTTCMAIGDDNAVVSTATETAVTETGTAIVTGTDVVETGEPFATATAIFDQPTATDGGDADIPLETEIATAVISEEPMITDMPSASDDLSGQTIYKTIYITRGGEDELPTASDEASLPQETEILDATNTGEVEAPTATDEASLPQETEILDSTATGEVEAPTATDEASLPQETAILDSTATGEVEAPTATDEASLPQESEVLDATATGEVTPTETLGAEVPEESLPADTTALDGEVGPIQSMVATATATAPLEEPPLETDSTDSALPVETSDPTSPIDSAVPTTTIAGIAGPGTGYPQMNSSLVSLIGTAPPSTFATIVASSMAKPFTPGQVYNLPTPPPFPPHPSVPTNLPKPETPSVIIPEVPKATGGYSYRFMRRS